MNNDDLCTKSEARQFWLLFLALVTCCLTTGFMFGVCAASAHASTTEPVVPNYQDPNLQEAWDWTCYQYPADEAWEAHDFGEVLAVLDAKATCHGEYWTLNGIHLWDDTRHPGGPNAGDSLSEWMIGGPLKTRVQRCYDYGGKPTVFVGIVICQNEDF